MIGAYGEASEDVPLPGRAGPTCQAGLAQDRCPQHYFTRLRCRWASAAVRETARVLLYRRHFVVAHDDLGGDKAGPRGLAAYCEAAHYGPAVLSAAFLAWPLAH